MTERDFGSMFTVADAIPGWLTREQAALLWREAERLAPGSHIVEIGSHQGRSTVVLAGLPQVRVTCIDPFEPRWRYGAPDTRAVFESHLALAGVEGRVTVLQDRSGDVRPRWTDRVALVYVDGKHDVRTVADDLRWAEFLPPGGRLLVHDAFSSIGVTLALLGRVLPSRTLRYLDRTGSLARFEVGAPSRADRLRMLAELPWWLRNVGIKVLLRLRLRAVARRCGHHDTADPY